VIALLSLRLQKIESTIMYPRAYSMADCSTSEEYSRKLKEKLKEK
jgi:hypothetical protein